MKTLLRILPLAAAWTLLTSPAQAQDFDQFDFGIRLQATQSRFSRFSDVAAVGNASAGGKWASSINPASMAWDPVDNMSAQYSRIHFDNGTELHVPAISVSFTPGDWGTLQPSVAGVTSNVATTRQGLDFEWDAVFVDLQWGLKTSEKLAVGATLSYSNSEIAFSTGGLTVAESRSNTYEIRGGALYEIGEGWFAGLVLDYANVPSTTDTFIPAPSVVSETIEQLLVWPGISYKHGKWTAFADYQFGLFTNDTQTMRTHRVFLGLNNEVSEAFSVRAGTAIDDRGNVSATVGIGIYPSAKLAIELAYQYDMFPEVALEFGRSELFGISISYVF